MVCTGRADRVVPVADMGDEQQGQKDSVEETARRARDEMHSVTTSLRALLQDLREEPGAAVYRRSKPRKRSQSVTAAS